MPEGVQFVHLMMPERRKPPQKRRNSVEVVQEGEMKMVGGLVGENEGIPPVLWDNENYLNGDNVWYRQGLTWMGRVRGSGIKESGEARHFGRRKRGGRSCFSFGLLKEESFKRSR
jgi:hypothetical protein